MRALDFFFEQDPEAEIENRKAGPYDPYGLVLIAAGLICCVLCPFGSHWLPLAAFMYHMDRAANQWLLAIQRHLMKWLAGENLLRDLQEQGLNPPS
jgi:hypothetical protein